MERKNILRETYVQLKSGLEVAALSGGASSFYGLSFHHRNHEMSVSACAFSGSFSSFSISLWSLNQNHSMIRQRI